MVPQRLPSFFGFDVLCDVALVFPAAFTSNHLWQEEYKRKGQKGMWEGRNEEGSTDYVGDDALLPWVLCSNSFYYLRTT